MKVNVEKYQSDTTANNFLTLTETDESNKVIMLSSEYKIVDVNSTLNVKINTAQLAKKIPQTVLSSRITDQLKKLRQMVTSEQNAIINVQDAIILYTKDPNSPEWSKKLRENRDFVRLINSDPESLDIYVSLIHSGDDVVAQYRALFKTATMMIGNIEDKIQAEAKKNGVYIQLGAWLENKTGSTPIHIPDFDDYTSQPAYTVERFQYSLTDEQKTELTGISKLADQANKDGLENTLRNNTNINNLLKGLTELPEYKKLLNLKKELDEIIKKPDESLSTFKTTVNNSYNSIKNYSAFINGIIDDFSSSSVTADPLTLAENVTAGIGQLISKTQDLKAILNNDAKTILIDAKVAKNQVTEDIKNYALSFDTLTGNLEEAIVGFKNKTGNLISLLVTGKNLVQRSYNFSEKVKKLSLDGTLKEGIINLINAGKREEGDILTIRLATSTATGPLVEQSLVKYYLYFCSLYIKTTTGFLFVNPAPLLEKVDGKSLIRYTASYSILLKGFWRSADGSRKNLNYHKRFAPGIGVNFAALNFNSNGTTELGLGIVYTTLNDFIQLGSGFNTVSGTGYIFLGLKIPVGSITFK